MREVGAPTLRTNAPAKINFGLRIVGRRPDGYHALESVFLPLDLTDDVEIALHPARAVASELTLERSKDLPEAHVPAGDDNLALRAARAFFGDTADPPSVAIRLMKRIPVAAGLGGGSSDAAAVLRLLAECYPDARGPGEVARLALSLGADVPFFLAPRPAWVTGIGERIEPLSRWPELALVLANPGVPLSTAEVFRASDASIPRRAATGVSARALAPAQLLRDASPERPEALAALLANDLEPAALRLCPAVARLRDRLLRAGAAAVGMSGSGPTVFGVFRSAAEARRALVRAAFQAPTWARVAMTAKSG